MHPTNDEALFLEALKDPARFAQIVEFLKEQGLLESFLATIGDAVA